MVQVVLAVYGMVIQVFRKVTDQVQVEYLQLVLAVVHLLTDTHHQTQVIMAVQVVLLVQVAELVGAAVLEIQ